MSSEQPQPFNVGDEVEHKCGIVGIVKACERRVVHGSTRWVVDIDAGNGEKIVQAWPHNCRLVKAAEPVSTSESTVAAAVENLLVANLSSALVRALKFHAGGDEVLRDTFVRIIREQLSEHRPAEPVRVKIDNRKPSEAGELREQLEEATAEFARSLSAAQSQTAEAIHERDSSRIMAARWRAVVKECELAFGMSGETPDDPKESAVPMRVRELINHAERTRAKNEKAIEVLRGVSS